MTAPIECLSWGFKNYECHICVVESVLDVSIFAISPLLYRERFYFQCLINSRSHHVNLITNPRSSQFQFISWFHTSWLRHNKVKARLFEYITAASGYCADDFQSVGTNLRSWSLPVKSPWRIIEFYEWGVGGWANGDYGIGVLNVTALTTCAVFSHFSKLQVSCCIPNFIGLLVFCFCCNFYRVLRSETGRSGSGSERGAAWIAARAWAACHSHIEYIFNFVTCRCNTLILNLVSAWTNGWIQYLNVYFTC